jgi:ATPase complex subunit ATP10
MLDQTKTNIGKRFPEIRAKSLAGLPVSIPEATAGRIALIAVAFLRESQSQLDSWLEPFVNRFGNREGFTFYEVPMISSGYKFMRFMIDGGMRAGIPKNKHPHVVTMYGDVERYVNELDLDARYGYAFLLDQEGIIRWQGQGFSTPGSFKEICDLAERLIQN